MNDYAVSLSLGIWQGLRQKPHKSYFQETRAQVCSSWIRFSFTDQIFLVKLIKHDTDGLETPESIICIGKLLHLRK